MNDKDVRRPVDHFLDKFGQKTVAGDIVVYAVRQGDTASMLVGKVVKIEGVTRAYSDEEFVQVQVRGIDEWTGELCKRNGVLTILERIVKYTGPLPEETAKLLETVCPKP